MGNKCGDQTSGGSHSGVEVESGVASRGNFQLRPERGKFCIDEYGVGEYVPPNEMPTIAPVEEALGQAAKGVDIIILGDINIRLQ